MRMLIIEDNHDVADTMGILLGLLGHDVRVAYCGVDGVAIAAEWQPSVVLSDIGLPDIDGFAVAQQLRQNKSLAETTLVAITAYQDCRVQEHAYRSGFQLILTKPADVPALLDTLAARNRKSIETDVGDPIPSSGISAEWVSPIRLKNRDSFEI